MSNQPPPNPDDNGGEGASDITPLGDQPLAERMVELLRSGGSSDIDQAFIENVLQLLRSEESKPPTSNQTGSGVSARAFFEVLLQAQHIVRKETIRLEHDQFSVCTNHQVRISPPLLASLFRSERVRIVHNRGNGRWDIIDPINPPNPSQEE